MTYEDGTEIRIGDSVRIERGRTPATVEMIIQTDTDMRGLGVDVRGVMLLSPPFGRVYWTVEVMEEDPLVFDQRGVAPNA